MINSEAIHHATSDVQLLVMNAFNLQGRDLNQ